MHFVSARKDRSCTKSRIRRLLKSSSFICAFFMIAIRDLRMSMSSEVAKFSAVVCSRWPRVLRTCRRPDRGGAGPGKVLMRLPAEPSSVPTRGAPAAKPWREQCTESTAALAVPDRSHIPVQPYGDGGRARVPLPWARLHASHSRPSRPFRPVYMYTTVGCPTINGWPGISEVSGISEI